MFRTQIMNIPKKQEEKMKRIIVTLVLAAGIVAALAAFEGNQEHEGWGMKPHGKMMNNENMGHRGIGDGLGMMCEKLDLSDAQKEKVQELKTSHQKQMIQLHADIEILLVDQKVAAMDQNFKAMKKITGQIFDLKEKIALEKIDHQEAVWNEFTPEQQEEAKALKMGSPRKMMQHKNMMQNKKLEHCKDRKSVV